MKQKRIEDYGFRIGEMRRGPLNKISDVAGVQVGHATIRTARHQTGVTIITCGEGDVFQHKPAAGCFVMNGYGKTTGLVQIEELGVIESPIALTNTLNVGLVQDALVERMINQARQAGVELTSVNVVVGECNDAYLNDIQARAVQREHVDQAFDDLRADFAEGAVGAGTGMSCHQLKGGIGSASRVVELDGRAFTLGLLALANYGSLHDLTILGRPVGRVLEQRIDVRARVDQGSIIIVIATDAPLMDRQLKRVCRRAVVGLARVGSSIGHGSGDIVLAFSTANRLSQAGGPDILSVQTVREDRLDRLFRAAAEATEEAILNALVTADRTVGFDGRVRESLKDYMDLVQAQSGFQA